MKNFPGGKELNKNYPHITVERYLGLYGPVEISLYIIFCILFVTHIWILCVPVLLFNIYLFQNKVFSVFLLFCCCFFY